jgi:hypothetical protein
MDDESLEMALKTKYDGTRSYYDMISDSCRIVMAETLLEHLSPDTKWKVEQIFDWIDNAKSADGIDLFSKAHKADMIKFLILVAPWHGVKIVIEMDHKLNIENGFNLEKKLRWIFNVLLYN